MSVSLLHTLREHWPEYLMEAWGLGTFLVSAGIVVVLLESPGSPLHELIRDGDLGRNWANSSGESPGIIADGGLSPCILA